MGSKYGSFLFFTVDGRRIETRIRFTILRDRERKIGGEYRQSPRTLFYYPASITVNIAHKMRFTFDGIKSANYAMAARHNYHYDDFQIERCCPLISNFLPSSLPPRYIFTTNNQYELYFFLSLINPLLIRKRLSKTFIQVLFIVIIIIIHRDRLEPVFCREVKNGGEENSEKYLRKAMRTRKLFRLYGEKEF